MLFPLMFALLLVLAWIVADIRRIGRRSARECEREAARRLREAGRSAPARLPLPPTEREMSEWSAADEAEYIIREEIDRARAEGVAVPE